MLLLKDTEHIQMVILASQGEPVIGVSHEDVRCYVSKNGGAPELVNLDANSFKEISSAMMPGIYKVSFGPQITDTVGELVAIIRDDTGSDLFDQYATKYSVYERLFDSLHEEIGSSKDLLEQSITGTETVLSSKLDQVIFDIQTSEGVITNQIDGIGTDLEGISNKLDGLDTSTLATEITELRQDFEHRAPDELALKKHLIGPGGMEEAPAGVGLWDTLEDVSTSLSGLKEDLSEVKEATSRILGLSHENFTITNQKYNAKNHLTEADVTLYPSSHDLASGINSFASYKIEASYDANDRLVHYEMRRVT